MTVLHLDVAVAGVVLAAARHGRRTSYTAVGTASTCARPPGCRAPSARPTSRRSSTAPRSCPIFGDDVSADALNSAAKLIGDDGVVYAVYVLPVPSQLSLDAGLEEEEAEGRSALESARIQARRAGIKIHTGLIRTRNPGAALVEEADARRTPT